MAGPSILQPFSIEVHLEERNTVVTIHQSPWVGGTRAVAYFGPVNADGTCETVEEFDDLLLSVCRQLAVRANELEAGHIVGTDVQTDPFKVVDDKVVIHLAMTGTAARLEPLF